MKMSILLSSSWSISVYLLLMCFVSFMLLRPHQGLSSPQPPQVPYWSFLLPSFSCFLSLFSSFSCLLFFPSSVSVINLSLNIFPLFSFLIFSLDEEMGFRDLIILKVAWIYIWITSFYPLLTSHTHPLTHPLSRSSAPTNPSFVV